MSVPEAARDLTRWNRAGLSRFAYVNGNAAVWLEELRLAMLARFARGAGEDARTEDFWRDVTGRPQSPQDAERIRRHIQDLAWSDIAVALPPKPETTAERSSRLLGFYANHSPDQAREIMRAFARAAHVLLGHADAYANEGYLRTATQWDSLRKLAAMIGYEPAPAASASTVVGLIVETDGAVVEVPRGVAMSFTPPGGGKPVIFETVQTIDAHPDLNAVRALGFDRDKRYFRPIRPQLFSLPKGSPPKAGDLVVFNSGESDYGAWPTWIAETVVSEAKTEAVIELSDTKIANSVDREWVRAAATLFTVPERVLKARARSAGVRVVIRTDAPGLLKEGMIVIYLDLHGLQQAALVKSVEGDRVELQQAIDVPETLEITIPSQFSVTKGFASTTPDVTRVWFTRDGDVLAQDVGNGFIAWQSDAKSGFRTDTNGTAAGSKHIEHRFEQPAGAADTAFGVGDSSARVQATRVGDLPSVAPPFVDAALAIEFPGKPSKEVAVGAWFVALRGQVLQALRVTAVWSAAESFFIAFDSGIDGAPTNYEFHGPMTVPLKLKDWNRGWEPVTAGGLTLTGIDPAARKLIKAGRKILVEDEHDERSPVLLSIVSVTIADDDVTIGFAESPALLSGMLTGWTLFHLNTASATHGESRGAKTLGSGNAELGQQVFPLPVKDIAFIPSNAAESGVAPEIDVAVQDVSWDYRDLSDPTANDTDSWSIRVKEDDTLDIVLRRRLPTGTNNIVARSHRVGSGPSGNAVPAYSYTKPSKKHRWVREIVQPIAASGGSARESVAAIRETAPSRLAANGRAVSLSDFEKLVARHAGVWQARAMQRPEVGASIRIVVVPADGGEVTPAFAGELAEFVQLRCIPGVRLSIEPYTEIAMRIHATVRVDLKRYDKNDVLDASVTALSTDFSLRRRGLGQPMLIGEVLAALESVGGVETATAWLGFEGTPPGMSRPPLSFDDGTLRAVYPDAHQIAFVRRLSSIEVAVEAL